MASDPVHYNVDKWITENSKFFLPPVCNKMMHNFQLKVFYVGGPNQRKDYHLEEGEELFYMKKGDMVLKILEAGIFKDVPIKEGEIFLLPGRIPHSPQRYADTVGLVIERERLKSETDGLRYFVEKDGNPTTEPLFERWFYCDDLGTQLGPVIKEFFASEQFKTGKPIPGDITENPPWVPDSSRLVQAPFSLSNWIKENKEEIGKTGSKRLFDTSYQSDIVALGVGSGPRSISSSGGETFIWMIKGYAKVTVKGKVFDLNPDETLLIPPDETFEFNACTDSIALTTLMDPKNRARAGY